MLELLRKQNWSVALIFVTMLMWGISATDAHINLRQAIFEHHTDSSLALHRLEKEILNIRGLVQYDASRSVTYLKILVLNPRVDPELASQIATSVTRHSKTFGKDPDLILAIIFIESSFDSKNFRSRAEAIGPMQVLKGKDTTICEGADINLIDDNIRCGIKIYVHYEQEYGKDIATVLAAYNRGPSAIDLAIRDGKDPANGYAKRVTEIYDKLRAMPGIEKDE